MRITSVSRERVLSSECGVLNWKDNHKVTKDTKIQGLNLFCVGLAHEMCRNIYDFSK